MGSVCLCLLIQTLLSDRSANKACVRADYELHLSPRVCAFLMLIQGRRDRALKRTSAVQAERLVNVHSVCEIN